MAVRRQLWSQNYAIEQAEKNPEESKCICPLFQPAKGRLLTPPTPFLSCSGDRGNLT